MRNMIDNFMHYRYFLKENVMKGVKLKYRNSYLGIVWSFIDPLLTTMVLTFVFGTLFGRDMDYSFPAYILTGRLLYTFYSGATSACVRSIRTNAGMIKKVYVPKYMYPLSSILSNYITFLISLLVLVGAIIVLRITPSFYMLLSFVPLLLLLLLAFGTGMILAALGVFFRDLEYLWKVFMMLIMYTCAIFYDISKFEALGKAWVLHLNPLFCIIKNFRNCIIYARPLELSTCLYAFGFGVVLTTVGLILFNRNQDKFILYV